VLFYHGNEHLIPQGGEFFYCFESKLSMDSVVNYSVHIYIYTYRSCMSGPSVITLL
jgi:hypothetical protein